MADIRKQFGGEARDSRFSGMPKLFATFYPPNSRKTSCEVLLFRARIFGRRACWRVQLPNSFTWMFRIYRWRDKVLLLRSLTSRRLYRGDRKYLHRVESRGIFYRDDLELNRQTFNQLRGRFIADFTLSQVLHNKFKVTYVQYEKFIFSSCSEGLDLANLSNVIYSFNKHENVDR